MTGPAEAQSALLSLDRPSDGVPSVNAEAMVGEEGIWGSMEGEVGQANCAMLRSAVLDISVPPKLCCTQLQTRFGLSQLGGTRSWCSAARSHRISVGKDGSGSDGLRWRARGKRDGDRNKTKMGKESSSPRADDSGPRFPNKHFYFTTAPRRVRCGGLSTRWPHADTIRTSSSAVVGGVHLQSSRVRDPGTKPLIWQLRSQ